MISTAVDHVPANKGRKLPPEPLTAEEVKGLIRACSKRASTGVRNRALIVVLYRAGLRISEALALLPKDLDAQASTIRVLHGKGDHDRVVGLDAGALGNPATLAGPPGRHRHQWPCRRCSVRSQGGR